MVTPQRGFSTKNIALEIKVIVVINSTHIAQYLPRGNGTHAGNASTRVARWAGHVKLFQRAPILRVIGKRAERPHLRKGALTTGGHAPVETEVGAGQARPGLYVLGQDIVIDVMFVV